MKRVGTRDGKRQWESRVEGQSDWTLKVICSFK